MLSLHFIHQQLCFLGSCWVTIDLEKALLKESLVKTNLAIWKGNCYMKYEEIS